MTFRGLSRNVQHFGSGGHALGTEGIAGAEPTNRKARTNSHSCSRARARRRGRFVGALLRGPENHLGNGGSRNSAQCVRRHRRRRRTTSSSIARARPSPSAPHGQSRGTVARPRATGTGNASSLSQASRGWHLYFRTVQNCQHAVHWDPISGT